MIASARRRSGGSPFWSDTLLQVVVSGSSIVDVSSHARTLTVGGLVTVSGGAIVMPGSSDSSGSGVITAPDSADFTFAGDFTAELFDAEVSNATVQHYLMSHWRATTGNRSWQMTYRGDQSPDQLSMFLSSDGTTNQLCEAIYTPTANTAFSPCVERSGNTVRWYVNGTMIASESFTGTLKNSPARLVIGSIEDSGGISQPPVAPVWNGKFKAARITAAARYASDAGYTVPSLPLPTS